MSIPVGRRLLLAFDDNMGSITVTGAKRRVDVPMSDSGQFCFVQLPPFMG